MELPKWNDYFLTLETRMFPELPEMGFEGAIYYPGLVCTHCWTSLKLGFVVKNEMQQNINGAECMQNDSVTRWRSLVNRSRYFLMVDHFQRCEELKPAKKKLFKGLSLFVQVLTQSDFPRAMFSGMQQGHSLSQKQIEAIEHMVSENGGLEKLLRRRDLMRRMTILYLSQSFDDMDSADSLKVESLLLYSKFKPLTVPQERLIYALEDTHKSARHPLTQKILEQWPFNLGKVIWEE